MGKTLKMAAKYLFRLSMILAIAGCSAGKPEEQARPNIILLVIDALRADHLGCYDRTSELTPNIDRFARDSVLFANAYAQAPTTIGTAGAILCSAYQSVHGHKTYEDAISPGLDTLAGTLRSKGYVTMGISTNPHVSSRHGYHRGFDDYFEDPQWKQTRCDEVNSNFLDWWVDRYMMDLKWRDGYDEPAPFFAMLWYIDPHSPYQPPQEYIDKFIDDADRKHVSRKTMVRIPGYDYSRLTGPEREVTKKLYQGEVNFFDTEFGEFLENLEERRLLENTIIILTADHGEAFWDRGWREGDEIFGHHGPLITSVQKIPLIIYLPGRSRGSAVRENVQHIDIAPTILEFAGIDPARTTFLGKSLKGLIEGETEHFAERAVFMENFNRRNIDYTYKAVIKGEYKLVRRRPGRQAAPEYKLFNVDYEEMEYDLSREPYRDRYLELKQLLEEKERSLADLDFEAEPAGAISDKERKQLEDRLRALGYIQ